MNSCVFMATVISKPELRHTQENQTARTSMVVEFDPHQQDRQSGTPQTATLTVVGWGNLATEIAQKYNQGDRLVVAGRLSMNTIEKNGYREKRAELIVSQIYPVDSNTSSIPSQPIESVRSNEKVVNINSFQAQESDNESSYSSTSYGYESEEAPSLDRDLDEIPF